MLTNVIDNPAAIKVKKQTRLVDSHKKHSTPIYSWDFEIQEPDVQETYRPSDNTLIYNDINAYVVDWEMPKQENVEQYRINLNVLKVQAEAQESDQSRFVVSSDQPLNPFFIRSHSFPKKGMTVWTVCLRPTQTLFEYPFSVGWCLE